VARSRPAAQQEQQQQQQQQQQQRVPPSTYARIASADGDWPGFAGRSSSSTAEVAAARTYTTRAATWVSATATVASTVTIDTRLNTDRAHPRDTPLPASSACSSSESECEASEPLRGWWWRCGSGGYAP